MRMIYSLVICTLLTVGAIQHANSQDISIPSTEDVRANKGMLELGFLNNLGKEALEKISLTDEQIANIELRLADAQARRTAQRTADLDQLIAADVAAYLAVDAVLNEHLTDEQLAIVKEKVDLEAVGKPEVTGKPDGKGRPQQ